jgi:hypothetical protein
MSSNTFQYMNDSTNYNRMLNNKYVITRLITQVRNNLGRQLLKTEKMLVLDILRNNNPMMFNNMSPPDVVNRLEKQIVDTINQQECQPEEDINIHELLKGEMGIAGGDNDTGTGGGDTTDFTQQVASSFANQSSVTEFLGTSNISDFKKILNPNAAKAYAYIDFDSRYRALSTDGTTRFQWNFIPDEISTIGTVNAIGDIRDITRMRIYPMRLPYNSIADNEYKRITMYIEEFSAQSFIAQENWRYHFAFEPRIDGRWVELHSDKQNDGYFRFRTPITRLETLTFSFGAPNQSVVFDIDNLSMTVVSYGTVTTFGSIANHNLETGDTVYISNFNTNNPNVDAGIIGSINATNGVIVSVLNPTMFSISVNSINIQYTPVGTISVNNNDNGVTGVGTTFVSTFSVNDRIAILGVYYTIANIISNTSMLMSTVYTGSSGTGIAYMRDNSISGIQTPVYFGSKRIFARIEFEYLNAVSTES